MDRPHANPLPRRGRRVLAIVAGVLLFVCGVPTLALWRFVATLPPLDLTQADLRSTVVLDREGRLLRPFATADGRWRQIGRAHV